MIPGLNLFAIAASVITPQLIGFRKFKSRTQNAARQWVNEYEEVIDVYASIQAVRRSKYKDLGLDLNKRYVKIFLNEDVIDLARGTGTDQFVYNGRLYDVNSETDWQSMDGWSSCLIVDVGPAPEGKRHDR